MDADGPGAQGRRPRGGDPGACREARREDRGDAVGKQEGVGTDGQVEQVGAPRGAQAEPGAGAPRQGADREQRDHRVGGDQDGGGDGGEERPLRGRGAPCPRLHPRQHGLEESARLEAAEKRHQEQREDRDADAALEARHQGPGRSVAAGFDSQQVAEGEQPQSEGHEGGHAGSGEKAVHQMATRQQ